MADNVPITAGAGTNVATDQVAGGEHYQKIKLADGTADSTQMAIVTAGGALKVDGSAVTQPVSVGAVVHVDDNSGSLTVDGSITAVGGAADDAAISGNPVPIGARAATAPRTSVSDGDVVYPMASKQGALITHAALRETLGAQHTTITSSTSETTIVTADATFKLDLYGLVLTNTSTTTTKVTIRDATAGTIRFVFSVPANDTRGFMLPADSGHVQAAANNNWTATCGTGVADLEVTALFVKRP